LGTPGISEIIKSRRAVFPAQYNNEPIGREEIMKILEAANWAPTHRRTEPWRFKVFLGDAKEKLADSVYKLLEEKIANGAAINSQKAEKFRENLKHVPASIAIIIQYDEAKRIPEWEEIAAVSMAVQNMWLTATESGLGAFWATPQFLPLLNEILEIKPGQQLLGFFFVGYIALDYPSPGRNSIESKIEWFENE